MKKIMVGAIAAVIVAAAAGAGYMIIKKNNQEPAVDHQATFKPESTDGQALTATITVTPKKGKKTVTVVKSDGQGKSEYEIKTGKSKTRLVFTSDFYYSCTNKKCVKFSKDAAETFSVDPAIYDMSQADINRLQEKASYQNQQPCPSGTGTCDVWTTAGINGDLTSSTVYLDAESHRVVEIHADNQNGAKVKIVYEYGPVTVDVPKNARNIKIDVPTGPIDS